MTVHSKQEAFDLFAITRQQYLASARAFMEHFAKDGRAVTVNDLIRHGPRLPEGLDPRVRGAVFAEMHVWERLGYVASNRATSHNRPIMRFRLIGSPRRPGSEISNKE
jgi:hypothetical protein